MGMGELTAKQVATIVTAMARTYGDQLLVVRYNGVEGAIDLRSIGGGCIDFDFNGTLVRLTIGEPRQLFTIVGVTG